RAFETQKSQMEAAAYIKQQHLREQRAQIKQKIDNSKELTWKDLIKPPKKRDVKKRSLKEESNQSIKTSNQNTTSVKKKIQAEDNLIKSKNKSKNKNNKKKKKSKKKKTNNVLDQTKSETRTTTAN